MIDLDPVLAGFKVAAETVGLPGWPTSIEVERLPAPHRSTALQPGYCTVYIFALSDRSTSEAGAGRVLKVGKVGPKSDALITAVPDRFRLMVDTAIETGIRWGELIALKPRHIDFARQTITVTDTIMEVSKKHSPTGQRYVAKPYPKDNEARTFAVGQEWLDAVGEHIALHELDRDDLLFATTAGTPISRNTFRTGVWLPAVRASGVTFEVRMHDLRHAHASWLLAGGADLKTVMDRLGHAQITTTHKYLRALEEADRSSLDAFDNIRNRSRSRKPGDNQRKDEMTQVDDTDDDAEDSRGH